MKTRKKSIWDTSPEDQIRVDLPANDCRRFNGGQVADESITKFWPKEGEKPAEAVIWSVKAIDRLRC